MVLDTLGASLLWNLLTSEQHVKTPLQQARIFNAASPFK